MWKQTDDGVYAVHVFGGFASDRSGISPGDRLIAINLEKQTPDEIVSIGDIAIYLETAGVDGNLTYTFKKPYSFADNYYIADLSHIDSVPRWTPAIIFLAIVDARNLFDFQTGVTGDEGSLRLSGQRRSLRGGILVRF